MILIERSEVIMKENENELLYKLKKKKNTNTWIIIKLYMCKMPLNEEVMTSFELLYNNCIMMTMQQNNTNNNKPK